MAKLLELRSSYTVVSSYELGKREPDLLTLLRYANLAGVAGLEYGREHGFTLHSLRHTFITHLMEVTGNDVGTVMKYSGHKSLEAFSIYLKPTEQGRILATQALENVDPFLILSERNERQERQETQDDAATKVLKIKQADVG